MASIEVLERFCEDQRRELEIPGLAACVVMDGQALVRYSGGVSRLGVNRKVTKSTCFHMASVTKTLTAVAAMKLVEEGKIELDAPLTKYFRRPRIGGAFAREITPRHLFSHTSGLPQASHYDWENPEYDDAALERHVRSLSETELDFRPGEGFDYSDLGFETLGHLIAVRSGTTYEDYVTRNVIKPARMKGASLCYRKIPPWRRASPHVHDYDGDLVASHIYPYHRRHAPSSTLCASINDMIRWIKFCNDLAAGRREQTLSAESFDLLWRPIRRTGGNFWSRCGHGFFSGHHRSIEFYGHEGSDIGFRAIVAVIPMIRGGISLISNMDGDNLKPVARGIFEILLRHFL